MTMIVVLRWGLDQNGVEVAVILTLGFSVGDDHRVRARDGGSGSWFFGFVTSSPQRSSSFGFTLNGSISAWGCFTMGWLGPGGVKATRQQELKF
jgi:hypothetical protein